ncbi:MAG: AbrB/MazE/SpoVT family DNA-binding domain-containing protein [Deltaproteobacteria bacterium]|nr:AbrB/MazE/SpoVT family DNA-binding domain-containing protein [Deltaproteobacteria bacterium]
MSTKPETTVVTERGQTSIPAEVRRALDIEPGARLAWEPVSGDELRVRVIRPARSADPVSMLGFARQFRAVRSTDEWMDELREGEE